MRIFNIMMSRDLGGIQQSFLDYNIALTKDGHNVINVTSIFAKINKKITNNIKLLNLFQWCFFSKIYLRFLIFIYKPDLLLAHGNRAITFAYSFKPASIPLIGIAHNYNIKNLKKCDYILSITHILIDYLTSHGFDKQRIFHIPNMKNIAHDYKDKYYNNPIIIGSFGRFVAKKGFNYLIEAIALLKHQKYNIKLILGGGGEEEENLKKLVKDLNVIKEVSFVGWVKDKNKFFDQIDIFCLPSTSEPFGIVLLEAIEHSTPIIATKSGGPAEILTDKENALLVKLESSPDIAEKLTELILDPELAKRLAYAAYLRLITNYDINIIAKKLTTILNQINSKKPKIL